MSLGVCPQERNHPIDSLTDAFSANAPLVVQGNPALFSLAVVKKFGGINSSPSSR